eukprot:scaffold19151_cov45-Isochrysis_galbana.AAC.1
MASSVTAPRRRRPCLGVTTPEISPLCPRGRRPRRNPHRTGRHRNGSVACGRGSGRRGRAWGATGGVRRRP